MSVPSMIKRALLGRPIVVRRWWENFLHNQNALRLKAALLGVPWVVVMSVPFHIGAQAD